MNIPSVNVPISVKKIMCSPRFAELAENTIVAVSTETVLKMAGRPAFILADKKTDSETKKYASLKEFLYQGTCLGLYLGIVPFVKKGLNIVINKSLAKNSENAESMAAYKAESSILENAKQEYKKSGSYVERTLESFGLKKNDGIKKAKEIFHDAEKVFKEKLADASNPKMHLCKGSKELSAIIGSVVTLAIIAPQLSHYIVHPMMKVMGFKDKKAEGLKPQTATQSSVKA